MAAAASVTEVVEFTDTLRLLWSFATPGQHGVILATSAVDAATEKVTYTIPVTTGQYFVRLRITGAVTPEGFVLIPAGSFSMGDSFSEATINERPVHIVTLSAFYMAKTETTKAQWDEVRTWGLTHGYTDLYAGAGFLSLHEPGGEFCGQRLRAFRHGG